MPDPLRTTTGQNQRTLKPEGPLNEGNLKEVHQLSKSRRESCDWRKVSNEGFRFTRGVVE